MSQEEDDLQKLDVIMAMAARARGCTCEKVVLKYLDGLPEKGKVVNVEMQHDAGCPANPEEGRDDGQDAA